MRAIVQHRYGSTDFLELREIDRPPVGDGGVLVRVRAASVNAADWHLTEGLPRIVGMLLRGPRNRARGLDVAGHVEAVGKDVKRFQPGDDVFGTGTGSFAEYVATSEDRLAPKPRNLTFVQAAAIPVAGLMALQGLRDRAHVQVGQSVVIYGAGGGVGTFAVQIARALGAQLRPLIDVLGEWGQRWARAQIGRDDLDAGLLMWDIHRRVDVDALPPERVVVRFDFRRAPTTMRCPRTWWLVLDRSEVDLCLKDPGFPVDVVVTADLRTLTRVWMGDVPVAETLRAGSIRLEGPPSFVRAFPTWLRLSSFAGVERVASTAAAR